MFLAAAIAAAALLAVTVTTIRPLPGVITQTLYSFTEKVLSASAALNCLTSSKKIFSGQCPVFNGHP
jgi:hypothetical protein